MSIAAWGLIGIPVAVFMLGAIYGGIRGAIRFAQYLTRSEASQADTARTNQQIATQLNSYIQKTDQRFENHEHRITVIETKVGSL